MARGFNKLDDAIKVLGRYQGLTGATRRSWAREHEPELVGYIRGYLAGLDWLYQLANKEEAIRIFRKNLPNMAPELVEKTYGILLDPQDGFARKGELDIEGIKTVLALRTQYGEPTKTLTDPAKYTDLTYYDKARGR
jgi:ABC-type nitrate/sulfonate/bicarbonate transport system substrate-binding protein